MLKKLTLFTLFLGFTTLFYAQDALTYQSPPQEIKELIEAPLPPTVSLDSQGENIVFLFREPYKSIAQLSQPEMRIGGLRINPVTNIGSRTVFYNNLKVGTTKNTQQRAVNGLPADPQLSNFSFSPNDKYLSFTNTTTEGVELWLVDIAKAEAKKLTDDRLNANLGSVATWNPDSQSLLVKFLPENRKELIDSGEEIPKGPTVSASDGKKAQNRTYQDLLKNPVDESNFEILAQAEIKKVGIDGKVTDFLPKAMYRSLQISPEGNHVLVTKMNRPFSYIVPYTRFPYQEIVYDSQGKEVAVVNEVPLNEVLPQGFNSSREGKRNMNWRADKKATLYWIEAQDKGDPKVKTDYRDAVYQLEAPFTGEKQLLVKTVNRYSGITWGNDRYAVVYDTWFADRNTKTYVFNPSDNTQSPKVLNDRNYQDYYSDPGSFITARNDFRRRVLELDGQQAYLKGPGYSDEGQFPFIDQINLENGKTKRLYKSAYKDKAETLSSVIDLKKGLVLVRIEAQDEYPNYYLRNINRKNSLKPITQFENPFKGLEGVQKEVFNYKRDDGLDLQGTLYLPAGFDKKNPERLPMLLWAYPREYKDKSTASQNTSNPNKFVYPSYGSPIFWVTQGYVVLDGAGFPIVGEGDEEPNDTFRPQLVANGKAAIDALDELGYIDPSRVGVGGHSYGAFMTANLLSHSDLFAAGIARSGAYNRTLTPFGFQYEQRNYWEAPDVYFTMSPFMHVDKMKTPLLLIHGVEDNNAGTYPMQSERYFNALKGFGATARLVMLPKESHGYAAKESILHMLWEQHQWLEKYVKNKGQETGE